MLHADDYLRLVLEVLPPVELSQNRRNRSGERVVTTRWGGRYSLDHADAVAAWRQSMKMVAERVARVRGIEAQLPAAHLQWVVTFEVPNFARFVHDQSNAVELCKPLLDGLVLARYVKDDSWDQVQMRAGPVRVRGAAERTIMDVWLSWA